MEPAIRQILLGVKSQADAQVEIPSFKGELEPHQRVGTAFLCLAKKALLLDLMGFGKTVQSIAADLYLRSRSKVFRTLVICQSGKRWDWAEEYKKFSDLSTYIVEGDKQNRQQIWLAGSNDTAVTIASYDSVRADLLEKTERRGDFCPSSLLPYVKADLIIFDEISVFKNPDTVLAQSLSYLVHQARPEYCFGLSATPIQKTLEDLWSIMDKIVPGLLPDRWSYEARYVIKQRMQRGRARYDRILGYQNQAELAHVVAPYFIRREKQDVVSDKKIHRFKLRHVQLGQEQREAYRKVQKEIRDSKDMTQILKRQLELQYCCDSLSHFDPNDHTSAKIDDIKWLLENDLKHEKVVIFSCFKKTLDEVRSQVLNPLNIGYIYYKGEMDPEFRHNELKRFSNDPGTRVALITTAAEMGLNLQAASCIIFINHISNPARVAQLVGRIDRPFAKGGHNQTLSIHYVAAGTFESKIVPKLYQEAQLMSTIFGASNQFEELKNQDDVFTKMNREELRALLLEELR